MVTRISDSSSVISLSDKFRYCSSEEIRKFGPEAYAALYREVFGYDLLSKSRTGSDADKVANLLSRLGLVEPNPEDNTHIWPTYNLAVKSHAAVYDPECSPQE